MIIAWDIDFMEEKRYVMYMKFSELSLNADILKALKKMGYSELTPIQEKTFTHIIDGRDMIATAETGSGKTSACGIPLTQLVDKSKKVIQVLVLVPTRELALQYVEEINKIARFIEVIPFAVYGGFDIDVQKAKIGDMVHILIATPGRLIDLIYRGNLSLSEVRTLVLDEADEMLKLGFLEDIDFIISCLVHQHQTLLFSATMPEEVKRMAASYLSDPVMIELNLDQVAPQSLEHHFLYVSRTGKEEALLDYLESKKMVQAIIFCNTRSSADRLFLKLENRVKAVEIIHGRLEQAKRTSIIRRFRNQNIRIMVATDLAGRGLDFVKVSHVFNYDFPISAETYTHRTGRAGRMGRTGIALTLVTTRDLRALRRLLAVNRITPVWLGNEPQFPTGRTKHRSDGNRSGTNRSGRNRSGRNRSRRNRSRRNRGARSGNRDIKGDSGRAPSGRSGDPE